MQRTLPTYVAVLALAVTAACPLAARAERPVPVDSAAHPSDPPDTRQPPLAQNPQPVASETIASSRVGGFDALDGNGDGSLSASEFAADSAKDRDFARLDLDGDGKISRQEWNKGQMPQSGDKH